MNSFYIDKNDIKPFMAGLFKGSELDKLLLRTFEAKARTTTILDGKLNKSFFEEEPSEDYIVWEDIRELAFSSIKGSKSPNLMKIILSLPSQRLEEFSPNAAALFINILYENGELLISTGSAQKEFSLDRSFEALWADYAVKLLKAMGITPIKR